MTHVILQSCCSDAACVSVCPVDCIHPAPGEPGFGTTEMLYIDPRSCVDCGACVDVCPVGAIVPDVALKELEAPFLDLNRLYFQSRKFQRSDRVLPDRRIELADREPLRVAVVGAGPAAMYAVEALLAQRNLASEVTVYERLPVPYGLARFGVAPDHVQTKQITSHFERTASRRGVTFNFNTTVGRDVSHSDLLKSHHAVLYAVGAPSDRRLDVPGEDLKGSHAATEFVGWVNGHPDHANREFDLSHPRAVVIGNGNVALDVARILTAEVDQLRATDISPRALDALAKSAVRQVDVIGRRGVAQAAFTAKELIELGSLDGVDVFAQPDEIALDPATQAVLAEPGQETAKFKAALVHEYAARPLRAGGRSIALRFLRSPSEILGNTKVSGVRLVRNELVAADGGVAVEHTEQFEDLDCGLVVRSVGYRGKLVPGVPFDPSKGTIPNSAGRVLDAETGETQVGVYTAGWIKRGPSGVIGTNRTCAAETVAAIVEDYLGGRLTATSARPPAVGDEAFGWDGWKQIDAAEVALGGQDRPRHKLTDWDSLVSVATGGGAATAKIEAGDE